MSGQAPPAPPPPRRELPDPWGRVVLFRPARAGRITTIGREKAANPLLASGDEDAFVKALLASPGTFPPYFLRLPERNRRGPRSCPPSPVLSPLTPGKVRRQQNDGAQVIDVRPGGIGAGILNHGTMTIAGSRATGNTAPNDSHGNPRIGGGIGNLPAQGGVPGTGVLTVRNSVLSGNSASGFGGGLGNAPHAKATVIGSTVSGNSAATGGGLASQGRLIMKGSLVTRNTAAAAGGIAKLGGTVILRATTVTRNAPDNCEPAGTIPGCTG